MGNRITNCYNSLFKSEDPPKCFICNNYFMAKKHEECPHVLCIKCNVVMHTDCYNTYSGERAYTKCPSCDGVGVIGTPSPRK